MTIQTLSQLDAFHPMPGVTLWKKDLNSIYLDANSEFARLFGFKKAEDAIGKTDFDVPCHVSELADIFKKNDIEVITNKKPSKFIEVLKVANNELKLLYIIKSPFYHAESIKGTAAYCVELSSAKYHALCAKLCVSPKQQSFRVIDNDDFLTRRESECLFFLLRGKSAKETGQLLRISPRTVEEYLASLKSKFGCTTKLQLIAAAIEKNYFNILPEIFLHEKMHKAD